MINVINLFFLIRDMQPFFSEGWPSNYFLTKVHNLVIRLGSHSDTFDSNIENDLGDHPDIHYAKISKITNMCLIEN